MVGAQAIEHLQSEDQTLFIAKFSATNDTCPVVRAEFVAMRLAASVGLTAAPVQLVSASGKDVLLVERFDREPAGAGWRRRAMV